MQISTNLKKGTLPETRALRSLFIHIFNRILWTKIRNNYTFYHINHTSLVNYSRNCYRICSIICIYNFKNLIYKRNLILIYDNIPPDQY